MSDQTQPSEKRRLVCIACRSRLILEEMCLSGVLPNADTVCDVCEAEGSFRLYPHGALLRDVIETAEKDKKYADFAEGLRYLIVEAIIAELNDPRNQVEQVGFREGLQRARIIVDNVCRNGGYRP